MLNNTYSIIRIQGEFHSLILLFGLWLFIRHTVSRREFLPWMLLWLLVFGYSWRILFPSELSSSRYSAALLYPLALVCGYIMAYWYRGHLDLFKFRISGKWVLLLIVGVIVSYAVAKFSRIQPKPLKYAGGVISRDCGASSGIILCNKDGSRLSYYSGLDMRNIPNHILSGSPDDMIRKLKREARFVHEYAERVYLVLFLREWQYKMVPLLKEDPDLRLVLDLPADKKSSLRMIVLTERPRPERKFRSVAIPNGDFAAPLPEAQNRSAKNDLCRRGITFFRSGQVLLPNGWSIYSTDAQAQAYLEKDRGNNTVKLHAVGSISLGYNGKLIYSPELRGIGFSARGTAGSAAVLKIWKISGKNIPGAHLPIADIRFGPEWKKFKIPLDDHDLDEGDVFSFELVVRNGDAEVDDFLLLYNDAENADNSGAGR